MSKKTEHYQVPLDKIYSKNAVWSEYYYKHFGISPNFAFLYGKKEEEIQNIEFKIAKNQTKPKPNENDMKPDYWGWFDYDREDFSLIYPKFFLLDMCFPGGTKSDEERNLGKAYRIEIINHP